MRKKNFDLNFQDVLPAVRGRYSFGTLLSGLTWFQVGGPAEVLYKPEDVSDLQYFLKNKPSDLPCFLLGHSMGGLSINSYLSLNPEIAGRLAGVIYSAPFFGLVKKLDFVQKKVIDFMSSAMDEIVLFGSLPVHRICRNK